MEGEDPEAYLELDGSKDVNGLVKAQARSFECYAWSQTVH